MALRLLMVLSVMVMLTGCSSTSATRMDPNKTTDLSGNWNDSDARMTAETMIRECMQGRWLGEFLQAQGGRAPVVIVGSIRNLTYEHIDAGVFVDDLQKALIDSGKVAFVASKNERGEVREERQDQQAGNTEPSTITPTGHETGADFMLQGNINAIRDEAESQTLMVGKERSTSFYQVSLELIDLRTNQKKWIGQQQVKKGIVRSRVF